MSSAVRRPNEDRTGGVPLIRELRDEAGLYVRPLVQPLAILAAEEVVAVGDVLAGEDIADLETPAHARELLRPASPNWTSLAYPSPAS